MKSVTLLAAAQQKDCFNELYAVAAESEILTLRSLIYELGVEETFHRIISRCEPMQHKEMQVVYNALYYLNTTENSN